MIDYYSEIAYNTILTYSKNASGFLSEIWANFDQYDYEEQSIFSDIANELENIILDCNKYFYAYDKHYRKRTKEKVYKVKEYDTLFTIANLFYGDPTKWESIYKANNLKDFDITGYETLLIPDIAS